jgi:hypothetical protein
MLPVVSCVCEFDMRAYCANRSLQPGTWELWTNFIGELTPVEIGNFEP